MIAAVVLAAGASTRFGSAKQAVLLEPVLERVRRSEAIDDIVVVLGAHELPTSARAVICPDWYAGPGASLRCGPTIRSVSVTIAATYGGVRLHPLLLAREAWCAIPDAGLRALAAAIVPCDDLTPPGDVDFAEDLRY